MSEVKVFGMSLAERPERWQDGCRVVAFFSCEARGIVVNDFQFIETARGSFITRPPRGRYERTPVRIADDGLQRQINSAAQAAYQQLTSA